jgi:four helix bundle protein
MLDDFRQETQQRIQPNSTKTMSYRNLEIWQLARTLVVDVHQMTLKKLPKFEMFEEGSQIRRSVKSVKSTIVEGYGRRRYKQEFIKFLTYSLASCDETTDHLETLFETESLTDRKLHDELHARLELLRKKLNLFTQSVERSHISEK